MNVVIVGGGVGGVTAALELARKRRGINVTLVDKSLQQSFAPSYLWVLNGMRDPEAISRSLSTLERKGISVVEATVAAIDLEEQKIITSQEDLKYDELILSPGAQLASDRIPGLQEAAEIFYTLDGAAKLRDRLTGFSGGKILIAVTSMPYKCPAAPYEAAFLIRALCDHRDIKADIKLTTVEPHPLPVAGPAIGQAVEEMLMGSQIEYEPKRILSSVDDGSKQAVFEGGEREDYDLLVAIPPHVPPDFVARSRLAGENGWILVDSHTLKAAPHIYAIGDVTAIKLESGMLLPKAGVFAHAQGKTVARNLLDAKQRHSFNGMGACFLETGNGKAGFAKGDFYASPAPQVKMRRPGRIWHLAKVLFERNWLRKLR